MKRNILYFIGASLLVLLAVVLFFSIRQAWAAAQADRKWQATRVQKLEKVGSTDRLEILPLYEEAGDSTRYRTGHGLSYLIKTNTASILMDIGNNPTEADELPLFANMDALGVSWDQIDMLVFSHFHPDHVGGVEAWKAGKVSFGKATVDLSGKPVYAPSRFAFPGVTPTLLPDPTMISPGVATIGSIEYGESYPVSLYAASGTEQVLAINLAGKGIVLVMGCGHPTVERIVARAEALFDQPVVGIVGGFHYEGKSAKDVQPQIALLQARGINYLGLSPHDSSHEALQAFQSAVPQEYREVAVGRPIIFP